MPPTSLRGKKVVITGAAKGIGRACVELFVSAGAEVYAIDIDAERLSELKYRDGVIPVELDLTQFAAVREWAATIRDVDVLVNNAANMATQVKTFMQEDEENLQFLFDCNLRSVFVITHALLPKMIEKKSGYIVMMGSMTAKGWHLRSGYGMLKAGLVGMTNSIALEHLQDGINCNVILPGPVEPQVSEENTPEDPELERHHARVDKYMAGKLTKAEDVANLVAFLSSDESRCITGQEFLINAGLSLNILSLDDG